VVPEAAATSAPGRVAAVPGVVALGVRDGAVEGVAGVVGDGPSVGVGATSTVGMVVVPTPPGPSAGFGPAEATGS